MGSARRQHHAQQEAMRAANRRANEEANRFEAMMRAQEEANKKLAEALKPDLSSLKPPRTTASTVGQTGAGVRTARSARKTTSGMGKGLASLRIPLNIGGDAGTGLNIG
jgi:protein subunit release factor B